jgi:hypothetical protein
MGWVEMYMDSVEIREETRGTEQGMGERGKSRRRKMVEKEKIVYIVHSTLKNDLLIGDKREKMKMKTVGDRGCV